MRGLYCSCLIVAGCAWVAPTLALDGLSFENAMVVEASAGGSAAISGDLTNTSSATIRLRGADSPVAGQTLLQRFDTTPGFRKIVVLEALEIEPGQTVELEPGATELKLVGLNHDLLAGNELPLMLKDDAGRVKTFRVTILKGHSDR